MNASMSARFIGVKHITKFKTRNMGYTDVLRIIRPPARNCDRPLRRFLARPCTLIQSTEVSKGFRCNGTVLTRGYCQTHSSRD